MTPDIEAALTVGLEWLYDIEQPANAVQHHLGRSVLAPDARRRLGFIPQPGESNGGAIVTIEAPDARWDGEREVWVEPLTAGELAAFRGLVESRGHAVVDQWNGDGHDTGSLALADRPHTTLTAAVARYCDGCRVHPRRSVFCDCEDWRAAFRRIVPICPLHTFDGLDDWADTTTPRQGV